MQNIQLTIALIFTFSSNLFGQILTDSTIIMVALWAKGDEVVYEFKETEDKFSKGIKTQQTTYYDVTMNILDSTAHHYRVKWTFDNYRVDYEQSPMEKHLMEVLGDIPFEYRTNELGAFETLENWEEFKEKAQTAFLNWTTAKKEVSDSTRSKVQKMLLSMFDSQEQVNYWLRSLSFFHYLYGALLSRSTPFEGVKQYTNPFIKKGVPGYQRVEVLAVDEENWLLYCVGAIL